LHANQVSGKKNEHNRPYFVAHVCTLHVVGIGNCYSKIDFRSVGIRHQAIMATLRRDVDRLFEYTVFKDVEIKPKKKKEPWILL